jgi:hypothetical protein
LLEADDESDTWGHENLRISTVSQNSDPRSSLGRDFPQSVAQGRNAAVRRVPKGRAAADFSTARLRKPHFAIQSCALKGFYAGVAKQVDARDLKSVCAYGKAHTDHKLRL